MAKVSTIVAIYNGASTEERRLYPVVNALQRAGVWSYCYGRGEPFPRLTAEQEAVLRQRYLPEVEALEKLLGRDLGAWKTPRSG